MVSAREINRVILAVTILKEHTREGGNITPIQDKNVAPVLEKQALELKKLNRLKSDFVDIVAHEFRTPISLIKEGRR